MNQISGKHHKRLVLAVFLLPMAACGPSPAQLEAAHDGKCRGFGAQPGTQAYFDCRMTLDQQASSEAFQRRMALSRSISSVQFNVPQVATTPRAIHCTSTPGYGQTDTVCR